MMSNAAEGFSICSLCIKVCHADHEVNYVRNDQHFCDCGAKGAEVCLALKPIGKFGYKKGNENGNQIRNRTTAFKERLCI